jgi:hypothetical protein
VTFQDLIDKLKEMSDGNKTSFLEELEDVHVNWHLNRNFEGFPIGFLSFHREVIFYYRHVLRKQGQKLPSPFTLKQLLGIHPYERWIDASDTPRIFSQAIENWHNTVHRSHHNPDFMDPRKNIYLVDFWRLHLFLNNRFTNWLSRNNIRYQDVNHRTV